MCVKRQPLRLVLCVLSYLPFAMYQAVLLTPRTCTAKLPLPSDSPTGMQGLAAIRAPPRPLGHAVKKTMNLNAIGKGLQSLVRADPDVVYDAMRVTVWGRWFLMVFVLFLTVYQPGREDLEFPDPHLLLHVLMNLGPLVFNGLAHHRLLTNRLVT